MKLTYFVNTMFMVESKNTRVLCDPWVTTGLDSRSGLFNFPELELTRDDVASLKPDYIYITHTHADHFDPDTLLKFPLDTPILVSWYKNNFTAKNIARLGFTDVRISDPNDGIALNGNDRVFIEPSAVYDAVDSLAVFEMDGRKLLNANDCAFSEDQCRSLVERFGKIDVACVPFGFQGPYPAFYDNLSLEEKANESEKKKFANYEIVKKYLEIIEPEYYFPLTGGAVYGGEKALTMEYCGVGAASGVLKYIDERGITAKPVTLSEGCTFDFETGEQYGEFIEKTHASEIDYLRRISEVPGPYDSGGLFYIAETEWIDLTPLFVRAREKQNEWQKRLNIKSSDVFFIDVGQENIYRMTLDSLEVTKVSEASITDQSYEIFRCPYSLMMALLTKHYNYSNVKTQFFRFFRQPNIFNPDLHILMSHFHI